MRYCILIALLPCALLAQISPARPADQDAFKKLPQRLAWLQPGAPSPQTQWKTVVQLPGVCSIPLLRAPIPKGVVDRMPLLVPHGDAIDPKFILPTPPVCEAWKP